VLRDDLGLTGAKYGCGEGQCGSCTVLLNHEAVPSCTLPVSAVGNRSVTTIEGLGSRERLHPLQQAFLDTSAFQCGFCTPGMILGAAALLEEQPQPSVEQIKASLEVNICRCGSYPRIVEAVRLASEIRRRG
jgi:aerobic-type carbon monoxide dehydrogenase small subunit (CoxS/CutS family)